MDIKVPALGESVTEATVAKWFKAVGDTVAQDEPLVELETDKVTLEVPASQAGTLSEIVAQEGAEVEVGALLGVIGEGEGKPAPAGDDEKEEKKKAAAPAKEEKAKTGPARAEKSGDEASLSPAVRKMVAETGVDPEQIEGTGKDGRLTKADVEKHLETGAAAPAKADKPAEAREQAREEKPAAKPRPADERGEERVRMTRLRRRIAERLKEAQNTAAMLTTFNEVDMTAVMAAREKYRDRFEQKHGVRLGFMSFFAKACMVALKEIPAVNAQIDGDEIVYRSFVDLGIAVGTDQGLVVPVLRNADRLSFAEVERQIGALGRKARAGELSIDELTGGTFTITNGGVYGSLLSTPILNPPQSGILGMHKIQPRPMAVGDRVEVRPMMYLAMSYDHRIIDGSDAVTFLVRVKECIEDPERIMLDI
ncbi:MAG: 2-oxoglutarate dehydrogenase complex dihydrolipoyllysine-residue succinyltransferase [Alphaproteobacteria bacterium]|nr:2-oxoglutarate dehydrogenase complex dihydrolipoyllysine-residue succinyltransferase [Alphaproteobacteria bacterium]